MYLCNKAVLTWVHDTVYLRLQLKDMVNFFEQILGRSWLTLSYPSDSCFLLPFGNVALSLTVSHYIKFCVVNAREKSFTRVSYFTILKIIWLIAKNKVHSHSIIPRLSHTIFHCSFHFHRTFRSINIRSEGQNLKFIFCELIKPTDSST